jgi:hypothetical protein
VQDLSAVTTDFLSLACGLRAFRGKNRPAAAFPDYFAYKKVLKF